MRFSRIELRVSPEEKSAWESEASLEGISVGELVRQRLNGVEAVSTDEVPDVDLEAEELRGLREWLDLADSDGEVDAVQLAAWKAFAAANDISFERLLGLVAVDANREYTTTRR